MEGRVLLFAFLSVAACAGLASTSPARRQFASAAPGATEAPASDVPATNDEVWDDDNDDFDLDGRNWYGQPAVPPSQPPEKVSDYNDYVDDDFAGNSNRAGDNASPDVDDDDDDEEEQEAEEEVVGNNLDDPEFSFLPPRDDRLVLQDDDEQSGPIKVRHTGRNTYAKVSVANDNAVDSTEEDSEHPYDFTIVEDEREDENKDDDEDEDEDSDSRKDERVETAPRQEDKDAVNDDDDDDDEEDEEEDELVSEDEDNKMFDDPEEDAAQVIYGDHVFLY